MTSKKLLFSTLFLFTSTVVMAQSEPGLEELDLDSTETANLLSYFEQVNEIESQIEYQTGEIDLSERVNLTVPEGYKYIDKASSKKIVIDFWGNPDRDDILGMLVLDSFSLANPDDWAFIMTEELDGHVDDEDALDIDYDDMLEEMQDEEGEINEERESAGYGPIHTVGWAAKPYYDETAKILHWAKELNFDNSDDNTLNYDVRILGRHGLLSLNAVGPISSLESVTEHIPEIIHIAKFKEGSRYFDFDPDVDKVAAYTVGGLVAGKLLAKAGILALLLKNIKLVALGVIALFSAFKNRILGLFGMAQKEDEMVNEENSSSETESE